MSITLEKRAEKVGIVLAKSGITKIPPVRVGLALDISGSAEGLYNSGVIQQAVDRLIAVAMKFDDNGELDMWSFSTGFDRLEGASASDEGSYVEEQILDNDDVNKWGGTEYGPVLEDMLEYWFPTTQTESVKSSGGGFLSKLFGKKVAEVTPIAVDGQGVSTTLPAMGFLITDGANSDRRHAAQILAASANKNIYWQLIGVGPSSSFTFLQEQADKLDNVGFVSLSSLSISDDELYAELIGTSEFTTWIKTHTVSQA